MAPFCAIIAKTRKAISRQAELYKQTESCYKIVVFRVDSERCEVFKCMVYN